MPHSKFLFKDHNNIGISVLQSNLKERHTLPEAHDDMQGDHDVKSRKIQNMPQTLNIPDKIKHLRPLEVHYATESELPEIIHLYYATAKEGNGISPSDVPSEEFLLETVKNPHPYHLFVVKSSGDIIGIGTICPSEYARSSVPVVCENMMIFKPGYTRGGLGPALFTWLLDKYTDVGYLGALSDCFASNPASYLFLDNAGAHMVGRVPYAGRAGVAGWSDTLMYFIPLPDCKKNSKL